MEKFIPDSTRQLLKATLQKCHIHPGGDETTANIFLQDQKRQKSSISDLHLIPSVQFYDIPQHSAILNRMMKEFSLGEHLLLVGPQVFVQQQPILKTRGLVRTNFATSS